MLILKSPGLQILYNSTYVSDNGCGAKGIGGSNAQGIQVSYLMTQEQFEKLKDNKALKIRIYTSDGYLEEDLQDKYYKKVQKGLALVD